MRKALKIAGSTAFVLFLSGSLFYWMVAGAGTGAGALAYVIMAAVLSVLISVTLCLGFHYICRLRKLLRELGEE